ncbi:DUF637 domain-containing protein, partial [Pseudomonas aeruginosa]
QIVAQGNLAIKAADGLKIDVKHIDQKTVSETIDVMVKADPSLAWLREAEKQGDVDWRKVREVHDSFKYSHSGLGARAALAIAIVVTYLTWGAGSSMAGVAAKSATGVAANSVASAVATNAAISTVNNRGNLGAVAKDVSSSDSLKGYAVAGISGGFMPSSLGAQLAVRSALNTVVNGGKFRDNVAQAAISMAADALSGAIFDKVGDALVGSGLPKKVAVHAIVGGLIGEAAGGDFRTAALAAGANEALVSLVGEKIFPGEAHERVLAMTSQLIGMTVAAAAGGDTKAQEKAAWVAQQATVYNNLNHAAAESLLKEIKDCRAAGGCGEEKLQGILGKYEKLSAERSNAIGQCASRQCVDDIVDSSIRMDDPVSKELLSLLRQTTYDTPGLLQGNPDAVVSQTPNPSGWGDLFALDKQLAFAKNLKEGWLTPEETADLDRWNASTSWLDRTAGRQLDPKEKAYLLSELGGAAAMALLGGRGSVGAGAKGATPVVTAEGRIGNSVFTDVNQTARPAAQANPNQPTLIADRVDAKIAAKGTPHPNGNMADAHAEIGVIQKAFNEGKTVGSDMTMNVVGKDVCGYCRGYIAAAASKSGLKSLTIQAKDDITGLPKTYYWEVGMKSIREKKI